MKRMRGTPFIIVALAVAISASIAGPAIAAPVANAVRFAACDDEELVAAGAECAVLPVPLDHAKPGGATVGIAISRIRATDPARRRGILLFNPGGPGGAGLSYPATLRSTLGDAASQYDLIGFDPRFVGRSAPISCGPAQLSTVVRAAGLDRAGFDESARLSADFARRCHERNAAVLPYAGTPDVARDMDAIRAALGAPKLSYYGVSYGADLGAMYSELFPGRVDRMVIDSVSAVGSEYALNRAGAVRAEAALDEWAGWAAHRDGEYRLGRTPAQVRAAVTELLVRVSRQPIPVGEFTVDDNILPFLIRNWLGDESNDAVLAKALSLLVGRTTAPSPELAEMLGVLHQQDPDIDAYLASSFAVFCADPRWPVGPGEYWRNVWRSRAEQPIFGSLGNNVGPCAYWRDSSAEAPVRVANAVPVLMVQALRDNSPIAQARDLHRRLTASRLVTADIRAHGLYGRAVDGLEPVPCAEQAINRYLRDGVLPAKDVTCG